jgi:hypothetical protein
MKKIAGKNKNAAENEVALTQRNEVFAQLQWKRNSMASCAMTITADAPVGLSREPFGGRDPFIRFFMKRRKAEAHG